MRLSRGPPGGAKSNSLSWSLDSALPMFMDPAPQRLDALLQSRLHGWLHQPLTVLLPASRSTLPIPAMRLLKQPDDDSFQLGRMAFEPQVMVFTSQVIPAVGSCYFTRTAAARFVPWTLLQRLFVNVCRCPCVALGAESDAVDRHDCTCPDTNAVNFLRGLLASKLSRRAIAPPQPPVRE